MPRLRFQASTRCLMALIASVGVALAWAVARPHPVEFEQIGCVGIALWSDGTSSWVTGPKTINFRGNPWLQVVDWPDGSTSYCLIPR